MSKTRRRFTAGFETRVELGMLEALADLFFQATRDDDGTSRGNLKAAKALSVTHPVLHKKRGMEVADMTASAWLYRQLKRFRAGVEAGISYLKR